MHGDVFACIPMTVEVPARRNSHRWEILREVLNGNSKADRESGTERASGSLMKKVCGVMPPISLERAQAAKKAALQRFRKLPSLTGVGITRVGGGYAIKLNLSEPIESDVTFPTTSMACRCVSRSPAPSGRPTFVHLHECYDITRLVTDR